MSSLSASLPSTSIEPSDYSRDLLSKAAQNSSQRAKIAQLQGEDAQCIADLLSTTQLVHEDGAFESKQGRRYFRLLRKLVESSKVLPQCYNLQDLQCDFGQAQEGGSFADIYEGEYRGQKICVKAVRMFEKDENTRLLKAMAKEAVLWAHLSHSNILPFYGVYLATKGRICIISPWMNRGDLWAHIRNYPDVPRMPLVLDVIAGLQYLHASNIVHGDLKAKNVLISDKGRALIADFGISYLTVLTNSASTQGSIGSVPWMAPELFDGDEQCRPTPLSDVWSFSCVCYEVVAGKNPFSDVKDNVQIMKVLMSRKRLPGDLNKLTDVNINVRELMNECWSYEPDSRPSCDEIYRSVVDLVGERDQQEVHDVALWKAIRGGPGMAVDDTLAQRILLDVGGTHELQSNNLMIAAMEQNPTPDLMESFPKTGPPAANSTPTGRSIHLPLTPDPKFPSGNQLPPSTNNYNNTKTNSPMSHSGSTRAMPQLGALDIDDSGLRLPTSANAPVPLKLKRQSSSACEVGSQGSGARLHNFMALGAHTSNTFGRDYNYFINYPNVALQPESSNASHFYGIHSYYDGNLQTSKLNFEYPSIPPSLQLKRSVCPVSGCGAKYVDAEGLNRHLIRKHLGNHQVRVKGEA